MSFPETVSTAEIWVAEDGATSGSGGRFIRFGTLKDVSMDYSSNDKLDETFEGTVFSRGRGRATISFDSVIPLAGKRIDFLDIATRHKQVKVVAVIADKKWTYQGVVDSDNSKFGLNQTAMNSTKIMCGEPKSENI